MYNFVVEKWSKLDLGFLEFRFEWFSFECWSSYDDRWGSSEFKSVSFDGGLFCVLV